jgi:xanthine dehydrogenase accessory factor
MSARQIIATFDAWREQGRPMVLATVCETLGSTYSKAGHRILIGPDGVYQGLVSGGCLEGDLAERAKSVLEGGSPQLVTYDMRDEADDLWGLGVGCNGLLRVFLQGLHADTDYEPFASIARAQLAAEAAVVVTVLESRRPEVGVGAALMRTPAGTRHWGRLDAAAVSELVAACLRTEARGDAWIDRSGRDLELLVTPLKPIPRLLVLGAGLDAVPLVAFAATLGWRVTVADHRPAYIAKAGFEGAEQAFVVDPRRLEEQIAISDFDAIIVMSHHLVTDQIYLEKLAAAPAAYLGVLGPAKRRARLLDALGSRGASLAPRLRGPVGLDIGADSPESIALSLLAEVHACLAGATAEALTAARQGLPRA